MDPYRTQELRRPTLTLGSNRARLLKAFGAFAVFAVNVGSADELETALADAKTFLDHNDVSRQG